MATYFPFRDAIPQVGAALLACQTLCALPARSTYSKLDRQPVGLLVTNRPFESAVQSMEEKVFQFFKTSSRVGWPESDSNRMRFSPLLVIASIFPSGESPEFMLPVSSCSLTTSCGFPFIGSNTENTICVLDSRE